MMGFGLFAIPFLDPMKKSTLVLNKLMMMSVVWGVLCFIFPPEAENTELNSECLLYT